MESESYKLTASDWTQTQCTREQYQLCREHGTSYEEHSEWITADRLSSEPAEGLYASQIAKVISARWHRANRILERDDLKL
ncbi:hypothetical protein F1880_009819 [Penicillium rolfsii]|nr:hypothetical protein F1880_009819 [Penicillium rolfsii]